MTEHRLREGFYLKYLELSAKLRQTVPSPIVKASPPPQKFVRQLKKILSFYTERNFKIFIFIFIN